jgi:two-component system OmpR family sensor kinase
VVATEAPRRWRYRSWTLRRRLVAGVLALLAVLVAGVGTTEVLVVRHALYARSASGLRTELALLTAGSPPAAGGTAGAPTGSAGCAGLGGYPAPPLAGPGPGRAPKGHTLGRGGAENLAQVLAARGVASAVVDTSGVLLACAAATPSGSQGGFGVPGAAVARLARDRHGYVTLDADGRHLLAVAQPVGTDTAVMVTDLAGDDTALDAVLGVTVVGGLAALAVAAGVVGPLLRSGLAPLAEVAATADAVAAGRLDRRVGLGSRPDEVARLGAAFDSMVDRLEASLGERDALVEQLRASEGAMRRFLADASHELRTPLTAIRGGAQVLRLGAAADPTDLAEGLGHIQTQAERMSRLVADLMLLSRCDGGALPAVRRPVDVAGLLRAERPHLTAVAAGHPLRVAARSVTVDADADALARAVANLVDNAAKYSPAGAPIEVAARPAGDGVHLAVTDHGPGVPEADRVRIFERFYRGDPTRARATGGAGLGLAIVAGIAADHGGAVRAEETPGGGTTIVVHLPLGAHPGAPPAGTEGPGHAVR